MISPFFHPHWYDPNSLLDTTLLYCPISLILTVCPEQSNSLLVALFLSAAQFFSATRSGSFFPRRCCVRSVTRFSLAGEVFSRRRGRLSAFAVFTRHHGFRSASLFSLGVAVFAWRRGFRSASRFLLGVAVFARRCCFLPGLGLLFRTDFGSWLLPVAARSGLCFLSFHFLSPFSFTDLKILLTTGLGYSLPYIILRKVFFSASRITLGTGFLSAACFSLGGVVFARRRGFLSAVWFSFSRQHGFLSAAPFSLGGSVFSRRLGCCSAFAVFARRRGFRSASQFSLGGTVFSWGWGYFLARILVPGCYLSQPGVVCVPFFPFPLPFFLY